MPETIRWGATAPSVLLRVARRTGRLAAAGLEVVEEAPGAGNDVLLLTDLGSARTRPDFTVVAAIDRGMGQALYVNRPDLRGATIGVDRGGDAFVTYALVESLGVSRDDYRVRLCGTVAERMAALQAGECDATLLNEVAGLRAEAAGYRAVARVGARPIPYLRTVLAAADPPRAKALVEALAGTATEICHETSADQIVIEETMTALAIPFPMAIRYLDLLKAPAEGLVPDGRISPDEVRTAMALRDRYGSVEDEG